MSKPQDEWIARLVPGKRFADIGGLWNTLNERVSVAAAAGASSVSMIDIQPAGNKWWEKFDAHIAERGVPFCAEHVADATSPDFSDSVGRYDCVYCAGVIYHVPSPYHLLANLRAVTAEHIILGSATVPEIIDNDAGRIELGAGQALLSPALDDAQRRIVRRHFELLGFNTQGITDFAADELLSDDGEPRFGPWWFLMPPAFIIGLARTLRLECERYAESWAGRAHVFLFRKK